MLFSLTTAQQHLSITSIWGPEQTEVDSLCYNSSNAEKNAAFFCIIGSQADGHAYAREAINNGASMIVGSNGPFLQELAAAFPSITFLEVADSKIAMAEFSIFFHNFVHKSLKTVAVTGTNGKTTVTAYTRTLLNRLAVPTGIMGTAGMWDHKSKLMFKQTTPTTPEAPDLHAIFDRIYQNGAKAVSLEATSIAIEQQRLHGIMFDVGIHTNLSPEHLDFHETMNHYKQSKLKLFLQSKRAVVNLDDEGMSDDILSIFKGPLLTYSIETKADVYAEQIVPDEHGTSLTIVIQNNRYDIHVPIFGTYNVSNLLSSVCACIHLGMEEEQIVAQLPFIEGPEGRFQIIDHYPNYKIILDYAHTPDALELVIEAAKKLKHRRLILMLTGIGLRDPGKRPKMAKAAEGKADAFVVSVDHPGFVDREKVAEDVASGFSDPNASNVYKEPLRQDAIHRSLSLSEEGDLVLITGLGFGGYQHVQGEQVPYDELQVIQDFFDKEKTPNIIPG
ncbi:UDP-N-acetylmuramoyl-L-alanyl-D-glutamate--2,6-diaminopimelate ligase [Sinobaca sp. H24]|uniref:UDP-N-acetylmuramoyl-L-alanyl-D-glutamate--2, 6-diaminopimelate ligase n=1 Tax=Sinobaca sp. H24 TaxID=2923376 RepID=UPI0020798617|nr:UDP-N-acetylmuramoyl-L-alanyl-D-glutamate--2,6-diaminopimelate ligase [Sinobaca sp. H24]